MPLTDNTLTPESSERWLLLVSPIAEFLEHLRTFHLRVCAIVAVRCVVTPGGKPVAECLGRDAVKLGVGQTRDAIGTPGRGRVLGVVNLLGVVSGGVILASFSGGS
jgi:hypothetical protein